MEDIPGRDNPSQEANLFLPDRQGPDDARQMLAAAQRPPAQQTPATPQSPAEPGAPAETAEASPSQSGTTPAHPAHRPESGTPQTPVDHESWKLGQKGQAHPEAPAPQPSPSPTDIKQDIEQDIYRDTDPELQAARDNTVSVSAALRGAAYEAMDFLRTGVRAGAVAGDAQAAIGEFIGDKGELGHDFHTNMGHAMSGMLHDFDKFLERNQNVDALKVKDSDNPEYAFLDKLGFNFGRAGTLVGAGALSFAKLNGQVGLDVYDAAKSNGKGTGESLAWGATAGVTSAVLSKSIQGILPRDITQKEAANYIFNKLAGSAEEMSSTKLGSAIQGLATDMATGKDTVGIMENMKEKFSSMTEDEYRAFFAGLMR